MAAPEDILAGGSPPKSSWLWLWILLAILLFLLLLLIAFLIWRRCRAVARMPEIEGEVKRSRWEKFLDSRRYNKKFDLFAKADINQELVEFDRSNACEADFDDSGGLIGAPATVGGGDAVAGSTARRDRGLATATFPDPFADGLQARKRSMSTATFSDSEAGGEADPFLDGDGYEVDFDADL
jgi:hypothetical protein